MRGEEENDQENMKWKVPGITLLLITNASLSGRSELKKEDKDENKSHTRTSTRLLHYTLIR